MKKFLIVALIGIVVIAGAWFGRSAYRGYKEKRAVKQAEQFLEKKDFPSAALSARQALQLNPNNVAASRIMAFLAEAGGSPHALVWRQKIAELEPTLDNKIILAACALRFETAPYPTATKTLREIADQSTHLAPYHIVMSKLALQLNDLVKAEKHLSEAVRINPKDDSSRLNLAAVHLRSKDPTKSAEALRTMEELRDSERLGSEALRWLLRDREDHGDHAAALLLSRELIEKKEVQDTDRFQHLTLLNRSKNLEFAAYLSSLQARAGTNAVEIYKIAAWQIASEMPQGALAWLDTLPAPVQAENPVPVARADALAAMQKWSELVDYLRSQKWGEQEFLRIALLARALKEQDEGEASQANWNRAVRTALENAEQLSVLAQLAGKWGWEKETESLLWTITDQFPEQTWALESINQVYASKKDTIGLLRVFESRLKRNSADTLSKNNVAMLSMLLKTNLPSAHQLAGEVYQADTNNWGFVSTYAYSLHTQGKTKEAVKLIQALDPAELKKPSLAAYYVILLSAAGEKETAQKYVALADQASILPEESKLLEKAKKEL